MEKGKPTVLYLCHDIENGGAFLSLCNLLHSVMGKAVPIVLMRCGGPLASRLEKLGCRVLIHDFKLNIANQNRLFRVCTYPARRLRDTWANARCMDWVVRQLENAHVDIVHTNSSVISFGGALASKLGAKHVWHIREIYDFGLHMQPIEGWKAFQKRLFSADALIAISKPVYDRWNMQAKPTAIILSDAIRPAAEIAFDPQKDKFVLFCATVLGDAKGADQAAEIFCRSGLATQGYQLRFVGNCPPEYRRKLETIAAAHGQTESLAFLGFQADIKPLMSKAAAFLMCSRFEGLGRVTIEALFYGCPVLGRDSGGTRDVIMDGRNGLLYSSVDEAAEKLAALVHDRELVRRLASAGAEDALKLFSEEAYGASLMAFYHRLLGWDQVGRP